MSYKTTSFKRVIAQIYRDFKVPHSGWVSDAIEWIGDAVETIGCHTGYEQKSVSVDVCDYRVKLPCDMSLMLGVSYKGFRLERSGAINNKWQDCTCLSALPCHNGYSYSLNPNYIHTSFKDGCITIHYYALVTDCDGFPEVPDNVKVREALTWYIMMKLCLRGMKHPTVNFEMCEQRWRDAYPRAQNSGKFRDIDDLQMFKQAWLGAIPPPNLMDKFWNNEVSTNVDTSVSRFDTVIPNPLNT